MKAAVKLRYFKSGGFNMKSTKYTALTAALTLAAAAVIRPFSAEALSVTDVRHLVKSLTAQGALIVDDDFNGDGKVNAVDLTLMKRSLLAEPDDDTGEVKTQTVSVSEENSKLIGRTLEKDGVTWLVHSGSAMECTVTGTEASVTICGDSGINSDEKYRPRYGVYVDGELIKDVVMSEKEQTVELFSGTSARTAAVKVMHLSEANNGCIGVKGITVTSSSTKPVKPTPKKDLTIEFIGDSITCAYGVEAESQYVGFSTSTENFSLSYAYLAAQLLDADYSAVCYSGHGIVSGYTNDGTKNTDSLVPPYYEMVGKPNDYQAAWDFDAHPVDVVVLNLGTNDDSYATTELEARGTEYQEKYEEFLKQIRKCNPDAHIICTLGIMGCAELYPYIEAAVEAVGDTKITCYESPVQDMNDLGADWHPSPRTHEKNAYLLADKIAAALGRPSDKIGIDLAAESKLESNIDMESGANAWPYYAEWNRSLNVNISAAGNSPESVTVYVPNLKLPTGKYELSFKATGLTGEIPYEIRSMRDPETVYVSGTTDTETTLKAFDLNEAAEDAEIVFMIGDQTGSITFSEVTLYKLANL
jgi:lysophospholipase L1-like esterase